MVNKTVKGSGKQFRVMITASGLSPVGFNTISSLVGKVQKIIGVDLKANSYARQLCDNYYSVPLANDDRYISVITDICLKEKIDTILPLTIEETIVLKKYEGVLATKGILIANSNTINNIEVCNDKLLTNLFLKNIHLNVPVALEVSNVGQLKHAVTQLGYPFKDIVFKPRTTHGSRGFRIITESVDRIDKLINNKPTDNIFLSLDELVNIIAGNEIRCMVMDKLEGNDYSVYCFTIDGDPLTIIPMERTGLLPGMSTGGKVINNKEIIQYVSSIVSAFKFNGSINIQLKLTNKGPLLYEINSRISATTVITRAFNINFPYYEVLLAHKKIDTIKSEIARSNIIWGINMERIHQEIYYKDGKYFLL